MYVNNHERMASLSGIVERCHEMNIGEHGERSMHETVTAAFSYARSAFARPGLGLKRLKSWRKDRLAVANAVHLAEAYLAKYGKHMPYVER